MKKLKTLGIITMVFLVLIISAGVIFAAIGFFGGPGESEGIISPEKTEDKWLVPESGKTVLIKTEAGEIEILLSDSPAGEKFAEFVNSGAISKTGFEILAENW